MPVEHLLELEHSTSFFEPCAHPLFADFCGHLTWTEVAVCLYTSLCLRFSVHAYRTCHDPLTTI